MAGKTIPKPFRKGSGAAATFHGWPAPKKVLRAGPGAVQAWQSRIREAEAAQAVAVREGGKVGRESAAEAVAQAVAGAETREVAAEATASGGAVIAHDGLYWLRRKGKLHAAHYDAGLRFRGDWELANGTGVKSHLADVSGVRGAGGSGPTDAMLGARGRCEAALRALGSPLLHAYVTGVAGDGRMLSDPLFMPPDPKGDGTHLLPCMIALDELARHYGMLR